MRCCRILIIICIVLATQTIVSAETVKQEYNFPVGQIISFPTYVVTYEVSDNNIAEVFKAKNGEYKVKFINPGDVYVRVTFYSGGKPALTELYLCHITGESANETGSIDSSEYAQEVLRLVNIERANYGLQPLKLADDLNRYATTRAEECIKLFSHTRPDGTDGVGIVPTKTYNYVGENINGGAKSPEQVVYEWMHSPAHRDNILFPNYDELGVGYVYNANTRYKHYWVQLFRLRK